MAKGTYQNTTIVGNLGQDPEVKSTASGTAVANLSVGVTTYAGKDQSGQPINHTEWFKVTLWGVMATNAGQYLTKGSKVLISGEMRTRKWQNQQGVDQYTTELHAKDMQFLGGGQQQPQQQPQQGFAQPQQSAQGFQGGFGSHAPHHQPQGQPVQQGAPIGQGGGFDNFGDDINF